MKNHPLVPSRKGNFLAVPTPPLPARLVFFDMEFGCCVALN